MDASQQDIKRAYHKKSLESHPDKNPDRQAEASKDFQEIGHAFEVLSDEQSRSRYDAVGEEAAKAGGYPGMDGEEDLDDILGAYY